MGRTAIGSSKYPRKTILDIIRNHDNFPSLQYIGDRMGNVTREWARQLIVQYGLYEKWVEEKEAYLAREKKQAARLADVLNKLLGRQLREMSWPERKANEYFLSAKRRDGRTSYDSLVKLFSEYERAVSLGEKTSITEFGESTGFMYSSVASLLRRNGLSTLNKPNRKRRALVTEEEEELYGRCKKTRMSCPALAYFTGKKSNIIYQRVKADKPRAERVTEKFSLKLDYPKAFEIYEAQNLGYRKFEISELLDMKMPTINYALHHHRRIKETIRHDLRIIYKSKIPERYGFLFSK